ncbi:hypothetical protein GC194_00215 [bacterium]|nr:hypothetical protein [bacterium]
MKTNLLIAALLIAISVGCFKDETWAPAPWTHHFNGPIAKSNLDLSALANLQEIKLVDNILASEIDPTWDGMREVLPIAGLSSENSPQLFKMTDYFKAIHTDSLLVTVDFTNGYPISFGKGTELVFRNSENKDIFFRHPTTREIGPGENYTFDIEILRSPDNPQKVESNIEFYLDNFRSPGSNGQVVDFTNASTNFTFTMKFISVLKLELYPDKEWTDTVLTDFSLFKDGSKQQKIVEGSMTLNLINGLPINGFGFVDILDENDQSLGVLFNDTLKITPATIDPTTTHVLNKTNSELVVSLPFEKLDLFYNKTKLKILYRISTKNVGSDQIIIGDESTLLMKLSADLKIYVDNINVE